MIRGSARLALLILAGSVLLTGCFNRGNSSCVKTSEYQASRSVEPLQVPRDLDELPGQGVEIPPPPAGASGEQEGRCLDEPPDYFGR